MFDLAAIPTTEQAIAKVGIAVANSTALAAQYQPHFSELRRLAELAIVVPVDSPEQARGVRLQLKNLRCESERQRKALKEDSLRTGQAIDGWQRVLEHALVPVEKAMLEIEEAEERRETARKKALFEARRAELLEYCDPTHYALGEMDDGAYQRLLAGAKAAKAAAEEAARQAAEQARIDAEEMARAHAAKVAAAEEERKRLQAEADEARKAKAEADASLEAERKAAAEAKAAADAILAKERAEQAAREQAARAEAEAEAAKQRKVAAAAKAEADRLAEIERKRLADERAAADAKAAAEQAAATAPDREKLLAFAAAIEALQAPQLTTATGRWMAGKYGRELRELAARVREGAAKLGG